MPEAQVRAVWIAVVAALLGALVAVPFAYGAGLDRGGEGAQGQAEAFVAEQELPDGVVVSISRNCGAVGLTGVDRDSGLLEASAWGAYGTPERMGATDTYAYIEASPDVTSDGSHVVVGRRGSLEWGDDPLAEAVGFATDLVSSSSGVPMEAASFDAWWAVSMGAPLMGSWPRVLVDPNRQERVMRPGSDDAHVCHWEAVAGDREVTVNGLVEGRDLDLILVNVQAKPLRDRSLFGQPAALRAHRMTMVGQNETGSWASLQESGPDTAHHWRGVAQ
ncbi:hypothetical protein GCM10009718_29890 [Isoptericola halotolerans]|uniref:Uncharacterized protein n=1 Tax=Isoptericola halotolerans TaxID=300560 RepID=A0ABX2A704_9MICO|nr:hypothetical protein [Isoptericola halotolerans]NOV97670.1 hypothetical protein [Isoptericola halotolerans]